MQLFSVSYANLRWFVGENPGDLVHLKVHNMLQTSWCLDACKFLI